MLMIIDGRRRPKKKSRDVMTSDTRMRHIKLNGCIKLRWLTPNNWERRQRSRKR